MARIVAGICKAVLVDIAARWARVILTPLFGYAMNLHGDMNELGNNDGAGPAFDGVLARRGIHPYDSRRRHN